MNVAKTVASAEAVPRFGRRLAKGMEAAVGQDYAGLVCDMIVELIEFD